MEKYNTTADKERLLCYSAAILSSKLSNPNNTFPAGGLIESSVRTAAKLIETIFDDEKLKETLK